MTGYTVHTTTKRIHTEDIHSKLPYYSYQHAHTVQSKLPPRLSYKMRLPIYQISVSRERDMKRNSSRHDDMSHMTDQTQLQLVRC
jgi:hypothetical protein